MALDLIKKEDIGRKIKKEFKYSFSVEQDGIYAIIVSAKAKSWLQNTIKFISFFVDDNLAVRMNGVKFPKLSGERGEFDGEASWNGNKLKGLGQVNLFVSYFEKGEQNLEFLSKGAPLLEFIEIYKIDKNIISIDPSRYVIEDGNGRPWFNILTGNIGLVSIYAKAIANLGKDDNDLQIRINGAREQNNETKAHKYWFWCGRVLKGQTKVFERAIVLKPGFNYIEFWADGVPVFNELTARVTISDRIPSVDDPLWTGDFYDDSEEMILARLIFGEARSQIEEAKIWVVSTVFNRIKSTGWVAKNIHEVILQDQQYESFNQNNKNRRFIENPLLDPTQKESWIDCYKVAEKMLKNDIMIPSEATHFHSHTEVEEIKRFENTIVPNGKFLKKIDDIYFYWSPN
ncbi:MAG: cell wall hydrolase [Candidatus Taylorbacteria bacterium]|nr:cell wall hydrolase [Candidatus Taylorbacteria bacterium]